MFYQWKYAEPKAINLDFVPDYFGVNDDYLLGLEDKVTIIKKHGIYLFYEETVTDEEAQFLVSVLEAKRS